MNNLTEETGRYISLKTAQQTIGAWIKFEKNKKHPIDESNPKAHVFGREKIIEVLEQLDCKGIKFYNAMDGGNKTIVVVGVDEDGHDLISGLKVDNAIPCPLKDQNNLSIL